MLMGNSVQTNSNTIVVSAASTFSGVIDSNNATQSSSSTTGSIIVGGVGIAKNLYVGGGAVGTGSPQLLVLLMPIAVLRSRYNNGSRYHTGKFDFHGCKLYLVVHGVAKSLLVAC